MCSSEDCSLVRSCEAHVPDVHGGVAYDAKKAQTGSVKLHNAAVRLGKEIREL